MLFKNLPKYPQMDGVLDQSIPRNVEEARGTFLINYLKRFGNFD